MRKGSALKGYPKNLEFSGKYANVVMQQKNDLKGSSMNNRKSVDIRLDFTPNPNALKYIVDDHTFLARGSANFLDVKSAASSPLARRLFQIPGVSSCMIGLNFVAITKSADGDWEVIDSKTREAMKAHILSGEETVAALSLEVAATSAEGGTDLDKRIKEVLDREIRPAVAMDGGDVVFEKFENGTVYLYMQGACSGCPSSAATLKMGIETRLKQAVPEVQEVVAL